MSNLPADQLDDLAQTARELAARAGDTLLARFQSALNIQYKGRNAHDPVTEVDHAIEDMVREEVGRRYPDHGVLGEERDDEGPDRADIVWVIDPLDGTSNFINGMGIFACSIGVLERGAPVAGAMFLPTNRFLQPGVYHARHGTGLHFDGEAVNSAAPDIQSASRLSTVPGGTGGVTGPAGRRFGVARTFGSTAAELTFAAEGAVQMALFDGSRIWDVAAGVALCLAAGRAVFTRPRGARQWRRFTRFGQDLSGPIDIKTLRAWNDSLAAGDPRMLPEAAADLSAAQGIRASAQRATVRRVRTHLRRYPKLF